jgi:hypothetical protein
MRGDEEVVRYGGKDAGVGRWLGQTFYRWPPGPTPAGCNLAKAAVALEFNLLANKSMVTGTVV